MTINEIIEGYKDLFYRTGKPYYRIKFRSLEKLSSNILKLEEQVEDTNNLLQ